MRWYSIGILTAPLFIILLVHIFFYNHAAQTIKQGLHIVCTTSMLGDLVRNIVHQQAHVTVLMGPGIDPHLYRAKETDIHAILSADIVLYHGLHLEGKMIEVLQSLPSSIICKAIADAIPISSLIATEYADIYDPHIWHDISLWMHVVDYVTDMLISAMPEKTIYWQTNALHYKQELKNLDCYIHTRMNQLPAHKRILVTAHDAFNYFGKAYGLQVIGLQGINTDVEIGIKDIQDVVDKLIAYNTHAVFLETSISPRTMHAVYNAAYVRNWPIIMGPELFSDALGDLQTGGETYCAMLKYNCDAIVNTLQNITANPIKD